ncbi:maleate cis-trans isomerase family protein [Cysteiniphilum sp. 19S12-1]|uniref:maleate cis-trans isomerase family protein n=1 Tax=Cysteiniphilum sp. 19S12-1 TaxID=3453130 RepID=UPI003F82B0E7
MLRNEIFDQGRHWKGKIGFLTVAMDQTVESDMFSMAPTHVGLHFNRIKMSNVVDEKTLQSMSHEIKKSSESLLPDGSVDLICFACTMGSIVIGDEKVKKLISSVQQTSTKVITLAESVIEALKFLSAKQVYIVTPYIDKLNNLELEYFTNQGFTVDNIEGFNILLDSDIANVSPDYISHFCVERKNEIQKSDCLFISCSSLRSIDAIQEIENELSIPVITSNQALLWNALKTLNIDTNVSSYGKIFTK